MKPTILLIALLVCRLHAGEEQTPWPPKNISFVVAYCYDLIQDERGANPVFPDGSLHKGVIRSATVQLSEKQQEHLMKVVSTETEFEDSSDCYDPHHAFVFYDEARRPVGWLGVCLACGNYAFSSKNAPGYISFKQLSKLCAELKLPVFYDEDGQGSEYTALYRAEQPKTERDKVLSWPQYLNRLSNRPLDWVAPPPAAAGDQADDSDPFADPPEPDKKQNNKGCSGG